MEKLTALDDVDAPVPVVKQCSLDKPTQNLMKLIFDHDMFQSAMQSMEIGVCVCVCVCVCTIVIVV